MNKLKVCISIVALAWSLTAQAGYMVASQDSNLVLFDSVDGSLVRSYSGLSSSLNNIVAAGSDTLYSWQSDANAHNSSLYKLVLNADNTVTQTLLKQYAGVGEMGGIALAGDTLYAMAHYGEINNGYSTWYEPDLFSVNLTDDSLTATREGALWLGQGDAMAYDSNSGKLYITSSSSTGSTLYSLSMDGGSVQKQSVSWLGGVISPNGMAIDDDGQLLVSDGSKLYAVDVSLNNWNLGSSPSAVMGWGTSLEGLSAISLGLIAVPEPASFMVWLLVAGSFYIRRRVCECGPETHA